MELKPCPKCRSDKVHYQHVADNDPRINMDYWSMNCKDCGISLYELGDLDELIKAWNKRADDDLLRRVKEAVGEIKGTHDEMGGANGAKLTLQWALLVIEKHISEAFEEEDK